ncbi:two-partner secretion domain-containing protein [Dactylococcopsis salina]|uniref:Filamentous hemagglutinin family N-terminal domain protein n=1 Tax=Dactylococcopsis salina (strain PCC 8305) TaxID=13035 RepID=K9YX18_DACS8|nr:filamentous hemagglutinin N-terminal domain-containing protein [Dactylococcopsis salina]AFZ50865.1 filamentous hemagglutinin family N-terminal domain protein [Dactylococcopsis salina PCC 8305]
MKPKISKHSLSQCSSLLGKISTITVIGIFWQNCAIAQLTPDNTLGAESSVVNSDVEVQGTPAELIEGGATRGSNLFHSFSEFNVEELQRVYFNNPSAIENILTRVTGDNVSNILGTLGVDGAANLFLLNPNGIVFGEGATLDINGSFTASNADAIQFDEQGIFSASNPQPVPTLTVNPSALLHNQLAAQRGSIIKQQGVLEVPQGESILLMGGSGGVSVDGGSLTASGGYIGIAGVAEAGTVELVRDGNQLRLVFPENVARSDIILSNGATVFTRGSASQGVELYGNSIELSGASQISTRINEGETGAQAGVIQLEATDQITLSTDQITLSEVSILDSSSFGIGDANTISLQTEGDISIIGSGLLTNIGPAGVGKVGEISLEAESISITDSSQLQAGFLSGGQGEGGRIVLDANDLITISGSSFFADVEAGAVGNGSDIELSARSVSIVDSTLKTTNEGTGNAGKITINATEGVTLTQESNFFTDIRGTGVGNGGAIEISAGSLAFSGESGFQTGNNSQGNAGDVKLLVNEGDISLVSSDILTNASSGVGGDILIEARSISLSQDSSLGGASANVTIREAESVTLDQGSNINAFSSGAGTGGKIEINTQELNVLNGSTLFASVTGSGSAGSILINASESVEVSGSSNLSIDTTGDGDAGNLTINTKNLILENGGEISTSTLGGTGAGGTIILNASESIELSGITPDTLNASQITTDTGDEGNAGTISINTGHFSLRDGARVSSLATLSSSGAGGKIEIEADEIEVIGIRGSVTFPTGVETGSSGTGNAGDVEIIADQLSVREGGLISASTSDTGEGGIIDITAQESVEITGTDPVFGVARSGLTTETEGSGDAGRIAIKTPQLQVSQGGEILASTSAAGQGGRIEIDASDSVEVLGRSSLGEGSQVTTQTTGLGNAGSILAVSPVLSLKEGAIISSATSGEGEGGRIEIRASELVELIGQDSPQTLSSLVNVATTGSGNAGSLLIVSPKVSIQDGAAIFASTFSDGNAGAIRLNISDTLRIDGESEAGLGSAILSAVETDAMGSSGAIAINANSVLLTRGGEISTRTTGLGNAGSIEILDADSITVQGVNSTGKASQITAESTTQARAGSITLNADQLILEEGGSVQVSNPENGPAGSIFVNAETIKLDRATVSAETAESLSTGEDSANIIITNRDLMSLSNESKISASAFQEANGGNINLNSQFIVGFPPKGANGSDISANAEQGDGGRIDVSSEGIFGIEFRDQPTPNNDFTVTSEFGAAGEFVLNDPDVDPSQGLLSLPETPIDAASLIDRRCQARGSGKQSSFVVIGRGGLPASPNRPLMSRDFIPDFGTVEMGTPSPEIEFENQSNLPNFSHISQGWDFNQAGELPIDPASRLEAVPIICPLTQQ